MPDGPTVAPAIGTAASAPSAPAAGPPFIALRRATPARQPVTERLQHWGEFYAPLPEAELHQQGARCMDCGVPFCQGDTGCPLHNLMPEWNVHVARGRWREAFDALHATNNFPELTGRLCPAPCESACVLGIIEQPVAIRSIEQAIADHGFSEDWVVPRPPARETGRRVVVVGSGPAGLAAAQELRRAGHRVVVLEKADRIGGLLRYGIPNFKLEKAVLDRRLEQLVAEGVEFRTRTIVGDGTGARGLLAEFDAVCLATGAEVGRDLAVPGRELKGITMAMPFLIQQNRRDAGETIDPAESMDARDKDVVIIGGGDTGSDCAGTCLRQGARRVMQFEINPQPPADASPDTPWPLWPMQLRSSHAHEEGCERDWSVFTTRFSGRNGQVRQLHAMRVQRDTGADGRKRFTPMPGSEFAIKADLVILAMGFIGARREGAVAELGVTLTSAGTVPTDDRHRTAVPGVFAAGDARRGASLIVWAIREGRDAAASINAYLGGVPAPR